MSTVFIRNLSNDIAAFHQRNSKKIMSIAFFWLNNKILSYYWIPNGLVDVMPAYNALKQEDSNVRLSHSLYQYRLAATNCSRAWSVRAHAH